MAALVTVPAAPAEPAPRTAPATAPDAPGPLRDASPELLRVVARGTVDPTSPPAVSVATEPAAPAPTPPAAPTPAPTPDELAGLLSRSVPPVGAGVLAVVPGAVAAPVAGPVRTVRVEVESGLPVVTGAFARFVMATLNDPRGWGRDAAASFARTDGEADIVVVLASPATSQQLCRPADTGGTLSCRNGPRVVITHFRWVEGHPDYLGDLTGYRHYVVNHEVGHWLGRGHVPCPAPGAPAPVMQQQTLGLAGCAPNPWPYA